MQTDENDGQRPSRSADASRRAQVERERRVTTEQREAAGARIADLERILREAGRPRA